MQLNTKRTEPEFSANFLSRCVGMNAAMYSSLIYFFILFCFHSFAIFNSAKPGHRSTLLKYIHLYCFLHFSLRSNFNWPFLCESQRISSAMKFKTKSCVYVRSMMVQLMSRAYMYEHEHVYHCNAIWTTRS